MSVGLGVDAVETVELFDVVVIDDVVAAAVAARSACADGAMGPPPVRGQVDAASGDRSGRQSRRRVKRQRSCRR